MEPTMEGTMEAMTVTSKSLVIIQAVNRLASDARCLRLGYRRNTGFFLAA